jgi:cell division protein FtsI/penicillin-binding protein 2
MKPKHLLNLFLITVFFLAGCSVGGGGGNGTSTSESTLPTAQINVTHVPDADSALRIFLDALVMEDYPGMYSVLSQASRDAISLDDFTKRYTDDLNAMSVKTIEYNVLSMLTDPQASQVSFHITYHTSLFGDIQRDFNTTLALENGDWRIQWDDSLILPELAGGKRLATSYVTPARGDIYDRNGNAIVTQTDAYALGLIAGEVSPDSETLVFYRLELLTGVSRDTIRNDYQSYTAGNYVPVGEASAAAVRSSGILGFSGVQGTPYNSRFYEPDLAPNAVGYTLFISPEDYNNYRRLGYSGAERIGWEGIEKWGENYLHGQNGATLYVTAADGTYETVLAQVTSEPASSITLTIDNNLQEQAQAAMDGLPGAIVVIEVSTGRVLAMVSSPGFDQNWYDLNNANRQYMDEQPTFNRATQGTYPLGSVFKVVTLAAALESGLFTPASTWDCTYSYTELLPSGPTLYDWTWERCQLEMETNGTTKCSGKNAQPSGVLTLPQGLMRSCDPWFYHIGYTLFTNGKGTLISDMAKSFGLGNYTGIEQVAEAQGNIPNPTDGTNATSIAIGQGDVLVDPLQVATFMAAIANGGTLYRPQLVEQVQPVSGDAINVFKPQANGTLPISTDNLKVIQQAMRSVVTDPRGTANYPLAGLLIPVAAKTGTAESGATDPHAWFAGFSLANLPNKPDIAVAVLVNNQGEGSVWAAPIFRRVMEIYFNGRPQTVYPWESTWGVIDPEYNPFGPALTPTPGP